MPLQRIAPSDFVFSNEIVTNNCWKNVDGTFIDDDEDSPSFGTDSFSNGGMSISNKYLGQPHNLQFSTTNVSPGNGLEAIQNIVTGCKNTRISWGGGDQTSFPVISIARGCYKSALLPGSLRVGDYTDDSKMRSPRILNCGRAYNIVQGETVGSDGFTYGYGKGSPVGLFLPDVGLILGVSDSSPFTLRTQDATPTIQVFIRARNNEYNYSMNPSFISGSTGDLWFKSFDYYPQTYITSIGLYNDDGVLMANAKLSKPFKKTFETELLTSVTLNF
jgi:hypothetical protein